MNSFGFFMVFLLVLTCTDTQDLQEKQTPSMPPSVIAIRGQQYKQRNPGFTLPGHLRTPKPAPGAHPRFTGPERLTQEAFRTLLVTDQQGSEQSDSEVLCWGIWYYKVFQIRRVPIITNVLTSNKCTELAMPIALIQQFVVRHQPVREENLRLWS